MTDFVYIESTIPAFRPSYGNIRSERSGLISLSVNGVFPKWNRKCSELRESDKSLKHELGSI